MGSTNETSRRLSTNDRRHDIIVHQSENGSVIQWKISVTSSTIDYKEKVFSPKLVNNRDHGNADVSVDREYVHHRDGRSHGCRHVGRDMRQGTGYEREIASDAASPQSFGRQGNAHSSRKQPHLDPSSFANTHTHTHTHLHTSFVLIHCEWVCGEFGQTRVPRQINYQDHSPSGKRIAQCIKVRWPCCCWHTNELEQRMCVCVCVCVYMCLQRMLGLDVVVPFVFAKDIGIGISIIIYIYI